MADYSDIARYLAITEAQQKSMAADDPYRSGSQIADSMFGHIAQSPQYDTKDRIIGAAITGLLGGAFTGLSDDYQGRARSAYQDVLTRSMMGEQVEKPSVLSNSIFADANQKASLFRLKQEIEQQQAQQEFMRDLQKTAATEGIKAGYGQEQAIFNENLKRGIVIPKGGEPVVLYDPVGEEAKKVAAVETAKRQAEADFWGTQGEGAKTNPGSPQYAAAQALLKEEDSARSEIGKIPSVSQFATMQKSLPLVAAFKDPNTRSSDVGFVYNFIKALDEGAVRGEEINMAQSANPLIQQYTKQFEGALNGTSVLSPALKNQMYRELVSAQQGVYAQAIKDSAVRLEIAKGRGVTNSKAVLPFDPDLKFEALTQATAPTAPITGPDGKQYIFVD